MIWVLCFVSLTFFITLDKKVSCIETTTSSSISVQEQCQTLEGANRNIWNGPFQGFNNFSIFVENETSFREHFCNSSALLGQMFKICEQSIWINYLMHKGFADWGCTEKGYADFIALQFCLQRVDLWKEFATCQSKPVNDGCMYASSMRGCLTEYAEKYCQPGDGARAYNSLKIIFITLEAQFSCKPDENTTTTSNLTATTSTVTSFNTTSPTNTSDSVTTIRTTTTSYVTTEETTSKQNDTVTTQSVNDATTTYPHTTTTSASTNTAGTTYTTQQSATTVETETPNQATTTQAPPSDEYECYKCNSGCNINKPNRKCPANGKMRFNTPTIKCTGPCISFGNTTNVIRGCSDVAFPDLTFKPTNTCLTYDSVFMCFCTGDRCNTRNMQKEIV